MTAVDKCCLDTNILIDVSRKKTSAVMFLEELEKKHEVCCSIASNFEMLSGARNKQEQKTISGFCSRFTVLAIDEAISWQALNWYVQYHLSHGSGFLDRLIAATAFQYSIPVYTLNTKHFSMFPGLDLLRPY